MDDGRADAMFLSVSGALRAVYNDAYAATAKARRGPALARLAVS